MFLNIYSYTRTRTQTHTHARTQTHTHPAVFRCSSPPWLVCFECCISALCPPPPSVSPNPSCIMITSGRTNWICFLDTFLQFCMLSTPALTALAGGRQPRSKKRKRKKKTTLCKSTGCWHPTAAAVAACDVITGTEFITLQARPPLHSLNSSLAPCIIQGGRLWHIYVSRGQHLK